MRCKGSKVAEWSNRQWCLTSQLEDFEVVFCQRIFCCKWGDMLTSYGQFAFLELSCPRLAMLKPWHISIGYGYGSNFGRLNVLGLVPRYDQALTGPQFHHTSYIIHHTSYIIHHIISYHIISYHIISYHIISYHIISYHIIIISYHIISYHIISYHIISYHIISYHIISYHIISYHIISYHIISYHIISYHIISYHIISYHIISYHIISYIYSST